MIHVTLRPTIGHDGPPKVRHNGAMRTDIHPAQSLNPERLRCLARARLLAHPAATTDLYSGPSDYDLNPGFEPTTTVPLIAAAVLVPVTIKSPMTVLLTERTAHLSAHAGQIAFPGGKIDTADRDACAAALREAHEEIGLNPGVVEPLGYLEPYRTGTGYMITPVVALILDNFTPKPDPAEVAGAFEVPLSFLMDERNHRIDSREWRGSERHFYAMPYEQRYIWGATAGIIRALYRRLFTP
jgi:8-oxo-dGTP pyrophosphatase MutT (NUDIX family)